MGRLFRLTKKHPKTSASASRTAASSSVSGFTFIDNSQGASAATAELSDALGTALDQIDLDGPNPVDRLRILFPELDTEASKYTNSKISDADIANYQCNISQETAQLISATWTCALATYTQTSSSASKIPDSTYHSFAPDHITSPSPGGTFKAMATHLVSSASSPTHSSEIKSRFFPALVIAIRGTASTVDGIVNLNGEPRDARKFLNSSTAVSAHSGFLNDARALSEIIEQRIRSAGQTTENLIFTGHSAGGAVATLLFLRFRAALLGTERKVSCVTFGAPPCVSGVLEAEEEDGTERGVHLNIVNEFDMVSRIDGPYILSMVNLLRSMRGLDGLELLPEKDGDQDEFGLKGVSTWSSEDTRVGSCVEGGFWRFPPPRYSHVGKVVVLVTRLEGEKQEEVVTRTLELPREVLEGLLFCRLEVHKRITYAERVKMLEDDKVHGW
ncbi:Alpha/Beta hydrolase protein [Cladorrhinum sp. PSN259]|nr:Alpha/Beta hydrolase protein [Cladorrhinum sp. PSN259]